MLSDNGHSGALAHSCTCRRRSSRVAGVHQRCPSCRRSSLLSTSRPSVDWQILQFQYTLIVKRARSLIYFLFYFLVQGPVEGLRTLAAVEVSSKGAREPLHLIGWTLSPRCRRRQARNLCAAGAVCAQGPPRAWLSTCGSPLDPQKTSQSNIVSSCGAHDAEIIQRNASECKRK